MSLDEERFVYNALYQTIFPAITFQRFFDAMVSLDGKIGRPFARAMRWAEKKWFGGWDEMHKLRFDQPEEDDGFFVYTFLTEAIFLLFLHIDELWEAGFQDALPQKKRRKVMAFYRSCLQRRLYASGRHKTMLSKATQSSGAVESLLETFPDAKFITIIRDPHESVASHVSVFWPVWRAHSPALEKNGPESKAYARLAVSWFKHLFAFREKVNPQQYHCIDYRELVRDPKGDTGETLSSLRLVDERKLPGKTGEANGQQRRFESNRRYSLEEFGLTRDWIREELGDLLDYYGTAMGSVAPGPYSLGDPIRPEPKRHHATCSSPSAMRRRPLPTTAEAILNAKVLNGHEQARAIFRLLVPSAMTWRLLRSGPPRSQPRRSEPSLISAIASQERHPRLTIEPN